ncbi:MAG: hypothetical protein R3D25_11595 [Geminicoccaceae bacterium]
MDSGTAELDVPVAQDATGAVLFQRQEADLAPDGREIDVELTYGWGVGPGTPAGGGDAAPGARSRCVGRARAAPGLRLASALRPGVLAR